MAIETTLLMTFLANSFVAANNAISNTSIDGGVANALSCLPAFLKKDTSLTAKVRNLAKGLEDQLGQADAHLAEQIIANAGDIVLTGTPHGLTPLLKAEGLDGAKIWAKLTEQDSSGAKILQDADPKTRPHTQWLVVQGLELWLNEPNTLKALDREIKNTIFSIQRDVKAIKDRAEHC